MHLSHPLSSTILNLLLSFKGEKQYAKQRKLRFPPRLHSPLCRLRDRPRQRLEVSVHNRSERRRSFRSGVPALPDHPGRPGPDHGIRNRPSQPKEHSPRIQDAGTERHQMAPHGLLRCRRQLLPAHVLFGHLRLDHPLFYPDGFRTFCRCGYRRDRGHFRKNDGLAGCSH